MKRIFTGFIRQICDSLAVRRPHRFALVDRGGIAQVSRVAFFSGNRDNVATRRKHRPRPVWRNIGIVQLLGDIDEMRPHLRDIAGQTHIDGLGLTGFQIVKMQRAKLLIYDSPRPRGGGLEIQPMILDELLHLFAARVIAEERNRPVTVREEVNFLADPHGIEVVRILAWNGYHARIGKIGNPDLLGLTAPVALPRSLPLEERKVGQLRSVRRIGSVIGYGQWYLVRETTL